LRAQTLLYKVPPPVAPTLHLQPTVVPLTPGSTACNTFIGATGVLPGVVCTRAPFPHHSPGSTACNNTFIGATGVLPGEGVLRVGTCGTLGTLLSHKPPR
jgi:hypothetical protein